MLEDVCAISEKVPEDSAIVHAQSFASLLELYETNKVVLQYLEEVIDGMRGRALVRRSDRKSRSSRRPFADRLRGRS